MTLASLGSCTWTDDIVWFMLVNARVCWIQVVREKRRMIVLKSSRSYTYRVGESEGIEHDERRE
ncbi:hypothetical protein PHLCEN_2v2736 [Hermanssonia centrifuga]|uniref:Uncharacterized protein n=1 Tax=Hermanssonia centrifuga TaxID=98765 RepID=A0A2R6RHW4_9APHY|nr:hypothetical protein PHLCEN_2v2736 [Hermanssonia centrifuga]